MKARTKQYSPRHFVGTLATAFVLTFGVLVSGATPSFAGTMMHSANGSAYCKLLTSYDKTQTAANKALETPGAAVAAMKAAYAKLKGVEATVLGVAPSSLQSSYKTLFKDLNLFYSYLSAANFNYAKMSKADLAKFVALAKTMTPAGNKINAYDKNVCGVKA
jgi:outer membrane lipoprotein-sorting protein